MSDLRVAPGVSFSIDFVTKTAAILAQRRKGKTYTGAVLAEELCRAKQPWVALDPTGAWWGLRSSADGQHAGLDVVVIGGQHGDLPLEAGAGAFVADLVLDHPGYYVLDLSLLEGRPAEREFSTAFGARLHRRKMQPGMDFPLHLFIDEADLFVPQEKETKSDVPLLAAYAGIVRRGGLHGLGVTLISQRPALVNKSALTQLDLLILLRLVAGQDQDAVDKNYVNRFLDKEDRAMVMDSLATLPVGTAWFLEPGAEPPLVVREKVRERKTFNSSATPKPGEKRVEPTVFADVDLEAIRERMAETIERAKQDDPAALRRQIVVLQTDLNAKRIEALEQVRTERVEVPVEIDVPFFPPALRAAILADYRRIAETVEAAATDARDAAQHAEANLDADYGLALELMPEPPSRPPPERIDASGGDSPIRAARPRGASPEAEARVPSSNGDLGVAARRFLETLGRHHPARLSVSQMAVLAGRKPRGGSFNTAMRELRDGGYVADDGGNLGVTELGLAEVGVVVGDPMTPEETIAMWREALPVAAREIFDLLVRVYPGEMTTDEIAAETGRLPRGGSWNSAVKMLTSNGIVRKAGNVMKADASLWTVG